MKISEKIYVFFNDSVHKAKKEGRQGKGERGGEGRGVLFQKFTPFLWCKPQNYMGDIIDNLKLKYFPLLLRKLGGFLIHSHAGYTGPQGGRRFFWRGARWVGGGSS